MGRAAKLARLLRAQVEAAVLQKLANVPEAPHVARLGQDEKRQHRTNARDGLQPLEVGMTREASHDIRLECFPAATELLVLLTSPLHSCGNRAKRYEAHNQGVVHHDEDQDLKVRSDSLWGYEGGVHDQR